MALEVAEADLLGCPAFVAIEGVIYVLTIRCHYLGKLRVELSQTPHPLRVVPFCVNRVKHAHLTMPSGNLASAVAFTMSWPSLDFCKVHRCYT